MADIRGPYEYRVGVIDLAWRAYQPLCDFARTGRQPRADRSGRPLPRRRTDPCRSMRLISAATPSRRRRPVGTSGVKAAGKDRGDRAEHPIGKAITHGVNNAAPTQGIARIFHSSEDLTYPIGPCTPGARPTRRPLSTIFRAGRGRDPAAAPRLPMAATSRHRDAAFVGHAPSSPSVRPAAEPRAHELPSSSSATIPAGVISRIDNGCPAYTAINASVAGHAPSGTSAQARGAIGHPGTPRPDRRPDNSPPRTGDAVRLHRHRVRLGHASRSPCPPTLGKKFTTPDTPIPSLFVVTPA